MKTTFYIVAIVAFSALMLNPKQPPEYPPKEVVEQRKEIVFKEQKINSIIKKIEYNLAIDSVQIHYANEQ
jgi:hypothetical protein